MKNRFDIKKWLLIFSYGNTGTLLFLNRIFPCNINKNIYINVTTMSNIYLKIIPRSGKTGCECLGI